MAGNGTARRYTSQERMAALQRLVINAGNLHLTARETGIPRPTLRLWRDQGELQALRKLPGVNRIDFGAEWAEVQLMALNRLADLLPEAASLDDVAKAANIAHHAHLDHTVGRRGTAQVNVQQDNRSITIVVREDDDVP